MFHYRIVIHAESFLLQSLLTPINTVCVCVCVYMCVCIYIYIYIHPNYRSLVMFLKRLFPNCPYVSSTTSKNILLEFTIYKVPKFVMFTNFWKNFVFLFAKSELVIGQFSPAFVVLFLRTRLGFLNRSHSHSKWSMVCGVILQRHIGSSMILNLWKYDLGLPCPVTIVDNFVHICSLFDVFYNREECFC
jgi:hypothetical protein